MILDMFYVQAFCEADEERNPMFHLMFRPFHNFLMSYDDLKELRKAMESYESLSAREFYKTVLRGSKKPRFTAGDLDLDKHGESMYNGAWKAKTEKILSHRAFKGYEMPTVDTEEMREILRQMRKEEMESREWRLSPIEDIPKNTTPTGWKIVGKKNKKQVKEMENGTKVVIPSKLFAF
jgi:hypothetical protein